MGQIEGQFLAYLCLDKSILNTTSTNCHDKDWLMSSRESLIFQKESNYQIKHL